MSNHDFLLEIEDPRALDWAADLSEATTEFVDEDIRQRLLAAFDTDEKIPYVTRRGEFLYNFWKDADHPRGVWRRISLDGYRKVTTGAADSSEWEVLIDVDELAHNDAMNWVWKGASVRQHAGDRALVKLSRGGADSVVIREFDLESKCFVSCDPFVIPEAKTQVSWVDRDSILVCTDFGDGTLTVSGYPGSSRLWRRGEPLEQAQEFLAGKTTDLVVSAWADTTQGFERKFARRALDFYTARTFVETDQGLQVLEVPEDATVLIHREWMFVMPRSEWSGIALGGLGAIEFDRFLAGERDFRVVFEPSPGTSLQDLSFTKDHVLLTLLDNVASRIERVRLDDLFGPHELVELPELVTASVVAADDDSDEAWISASSFTQPSTLYRYADGKLEKFAHTAAQFNAEGLETRQHWATSADGTKVPYFITGAFDGARPTLVTAYGGFEHALVPYYPVARGSWLEKGRYFVQANLRGGSEFGPQWHEQILKTNRYKIYEDHQAVLRDLVERGYATPPEIIVRGGSNGGLLTSVALTSYPELIGAAVVQVPLVDMMRYHLWSAGASWMAEYGDPEVPKEREALLGYSPLHNIAARPGHAADGDLVNVDKQPATYPPALVTTSTRDDRVHPAHARLLTLALQQAGQPVDYYENPEGGHAGAADNKQVAFMEALVEGWIEAKVLGGSKNN